VAEESGKGIALVILGIVAIIAIVGLVLLFTGARKNAAVGEFAVSAAKQYGGAVRGAYDPYAGAFSGRAHEYPAGTVPELAAQDYGRAGVNTAMGGQAFGENVDPAGRGVQNVATASQVLSQSANMFQATRNEGGVRVGDNCYFMMPPDLDSISDAGQCALYQAQGRTVPSIPALCTGARSRERAASGTGTAGPGQGPVAVDPYQATAIELGRGACFFRFQGAQNLV